MHTSLRLLAALLGLTLGSLHAAAPSVEFIENSAAISPTRTLELRFSHEMIAPPDLAKAELPSPVETIPAVEGKWTWQSTRSGVFSPSEPWPLATTIQIRLRDELKTAAGEPLPADWKRTIDSPAFAVQAWSHVTYWNASDAISEPAMALLFNADVEASTAAASMKFTRPNGETIAAKVASPDAKRPGLSYFSQWNVTAGRSLLTWAERFTSEAMPAGVRKNQLFVSPAKPLTPGLAWRLVVAAGLPAREGDLRTLSTHEVYIGDVRPFEITQIEALNVLNAPKRIRVSFTKPLQDKLDLAALARWIGITPAPANLAASVEYRAVEFSGDFVLGQKYRVAVEPGVPAAEAFVLAKGTIEEVEFEPIPARLYFEAYDTHQMRAGERKHHLLAVNTPKIRVSAKLFTGTAIPVAFRAYDDYYEPPKGKPDESHSQIDATKLPGQVVWQRDIDGTTAIDEEQELALDWSKILGPNRGGVVLLTAEQIGEGPRPGSQTLVQLTDLGAVWKRAPGETFVHVFSLKSGKGVPNARIRLLDEKDKTVGSGKTDEHGLARLPAADAARWFFVETANDSHLIEFRNGRNYIDLARVDVAFSEDDEGPAGESVKAFLFTERGVYRPGDTLHLKGILRDWRPGKKALAAGMKVQLKVLDAREREFFTKTVTLSALGSFSEDIAMPQTPLGFYTATLHLTGEGAPEYPIARHEFQVEEYKPNAFEITIGEGPKQPGPAELKLPVSAKYYMGKTLSKAQLTWSLNAHDTDFSPADFDDFDFADAITNYELREHLDRRGHLSTQGKVTLDAEGAAKIEASVPLNAKVPQPRRVNVLAEITDVNQQTVSSSRAFTLHSSDFYLGVRQFRSLLHVGEAIPLEAIAIRTDGTPMPEPVSVQAQLTRIDWQNNRKENADNTTEIVNEPRFVLVTRADFNSAAMTKDGDRWNFGPVQLAQPLVPDQPGQYLLELSAKDAAGRAVVTTTSFQVYGVGETAWSYRNQFQVEMVPEKDDYAAGETAKILVKTPISGDALVTVERERVLRSFTVHLEGNAPIVEVPLLPGDAPNVFVSVMLLRGADDSPRKFKAPEYRIGYCELNVTRPDAELTVYVKPGAKAYQPAEEVSIAAEVLDFEGKPVRDAEVTLFAVDEGVLSLTGYETPDPLTFFNEPRALTVSTALTLPALLDEDPETRDFANKGYLIGGGGDDQGLRKNFLACAFWHATLKTDALGKLLAKFTAPDSLTRYRVMAVVQTAKDQFGSGESAFEVNKPVMLEPALPRFANVSDKLTLRAVLHNTTDLDGEAEVRVDFDGSVKAETKTQKIALKAKATTALDFPVEFVETGTAVWKWTVHFTSGETMHKDAVQTTLKVGYPAPLLRHVKTMRVEGGIANLLADVDPQLLEGTGTVRISVTNSRAIELQEALNHLLHYPYGCVEQTTSSTMPWLTLNNLRDRLPSLQRSDEEIARSIQRGVSRLLAMQTDSGGLSYWPGQHQPMLWGSAYASLALTHARAQGHAVPAEDYERLMKWMSEQLRGTADMKSLDDLRQRCLVVYALALAGRAEPAYHTLLFDKRADLTEEDRALLALAILERRSGASPLPATTRGTPAAPTRQSDEGVASTMVDELLAAPKARSADDESWFWSPARSVALQLLCWTRYRTKSPQTDALAEQLFELRRGGHWWTTQGNVWSLLAMGDYLARTERDNRATSAHLSWGGEKSTLKLGAKAETKAQAFLTSATNAREPLTLSAAKGGKLYSEVRVESYPPLREQPAQDRGYSLSRRYAKVEDDGTLSDANQLRVGDRVLITLTLEVRQRATYVAVEDPLPAVFEAVNPTFKTQQMRAGENLGADWLSDYRELREDRALFFADSVFPGRYTIRYLARVVSAGSATAPSAKIEEMYHPERCGLTASQRITTLPLQ